MTSRNSAGGFTLIEMLVVLAVLSFALGLVALHTPARARPADTATVAGELARTLRLARARAIAGDRVVRVVLDTEARTVALDGAVTTLPDSIAVAVSTRAGLVAGAVAAIGFAPDGSSSGGEIELAAPGHHARIDIDWLSGRVSRSDAR